MPDIIQGDSALISSPLCIDFDQSAGLVVPVDSDPVPGSGSSFCSYYTGQPARPGFTGVAPVADSDNQPWAVLNALKDCGVNTLQVGKETRTFRTPACLCFGNPGQDYGIAWNAAKQKASFKGLWVCGRVWTCPVCARRICAKRAEDLTRLINVHTARGGDVYLLTFTAPHGPGEDLRRRMDLFQRAYNGAMICKDVRVFKQSAGFIGSVTSKEVTHGDNGWHDHYHVLWFTTLPVDIDELANVVFRQWWNYSVKRGLGEPSRCGFDVRMGSAAGSYVSKMGWGVAKEVALSNEKRGRGDSRHPFDLVLDWSRGEFPAGLELFMEYAGAVWNRQYLTRYGALAKKLGVDLTEKTDEQIAREQDAMAVLVFLFNESREFEDLWRRVRHHNKRSQILRFFEVEMQSHSDIERAKLALLGLLRGLV